MFDKLIIQEQIYFKDIKLAYYCNILFSTGFNAFICRIIFI